MGQLGLCTTITEALAPYSPCSTARREASERRNPHTANREQPPACHNQKKPSCGKEDTVQPKINELKKKKKKKQKQGMFGESQKPPIQL